MNLKRARNTLLVAAIALFMAGCGGRASETSMDSLPDTLKVKQLSKTYIITGIGERGTNRVAIINDEVVTPGMELDPGVVLKDIQLTYAVILHGNTEYLLRPENIQNELDEKKH